MVFHNEIVQNCEIDIKMETMRFFCIFLQIRNRLASFNVDPFAMSIVNQTGCPKTEGGWNIHIDSETFSTKSIANVFRKAGEKIGDGFEYTVDLTKKVF